MNIIIFLFFLLAAGLARGNANCEVDLNGDGVCDSYSIAPPEADSTSSKITINIGGSNKSVSGYFELGDGGLSPGYIPGDFSLLIDFHTRNVNMTKYDFRWDPLRQDWLLYKQSTWVEPNRDERYSLGDEKVPNDALFPQQFEVQRVACCTAFSQFSERGAAVKTLSGEDRLVEIKKDFQYVIENLIQGEKGQLFNRGGEAGLNVRTNIPKDFLYEMTLILSEENVSALNDYAYYLYRNNNSILAAFLLEKIHKEYPGRVVAILNLADAYWSVGMRSDACPLYKEYMSKMNATGKSARIPKKVMSRGRCG